MEKSFNEQELRFRAVEENLRDIREQIEQAAKKSGRAAQDITLLAATKTVPPAVINHTISCGVSCIGENRVQELCEKYDSLQTQGADVQFIGRLQTNKVRQLMGRVSMIQSVDSLKLANEISRQCLLHETQMDVLLEVNIGCEPNKSGVLPENLLPLLEQAAALPNIHVRGLMAIPPANASDQEARTFFLRMAKYFVDIKVKRIDNVTMDYLSMGMSADFAAAIESGANLVRVGSALFGERDYSK